MKSFFNGKVWTTHTKAGTLTAATPEGLVPQFKAVKERIAKILGHEPTDHEVEFGIERPAMTPAEQKEANRRKAEAQYLARVNEVQPSPEQARLKAAEHRANEARRSKLTHIERELEDATLAATAAETKLADEARRGAIRQSPAYLSTHAKLVDLVFCASFDSSVTQGQLAALESELESLETSQDIAATRSNLRTIQGAIAAQIEVEATALRQASDAVAQRKAALGQGLVFDDVGVETLGEVEYVSLSVGGETRKITKQRFDARESDESLRDSLFQTGASNV